MGEGLGEDTVDVRLIGIVVALIAEVVDGVRRGYRPCSYVEQGRETLLEAVVLLRGDATSGYTDELLELREVERVVGRQEEVVTADGEDDLLMLVDDMRREEERLFETSRVHDLQDDVVGMAVQLVGVMHLRELQVMRIFVRQVLEGRGEGRFAALRQSYDSDFGHSVFSIQFSVISVQFSVQKFCGAKLLLFADMCNP